MKYVKLKDRFRTSIKYYRFKYELSQEQLAEMVGVTDKYLSDLERKKGTPSLDVIDKFAKALKVDPLELLTDKYFEEYSNKSDKIDSIRGRVKRRK